MNPKIIIAALDAGLINYIDNETPRHYYISGNAEIEEVEKFAELLIRECANWLEETGSMVEVAMEMKQEFGIRNG